MSDKVHGSMDCRDGAVGLCRPLRLGISLVLFRLRFARLRLSLGRMGVSTLYPRRGGLAGNCGFAVILSAGLRLPIREVRLARIFIGLRLGDFGALSLSSVVSVMELMRQRTILSFSSTLDRRGISLVSFRRSWAIVRVSFGVIGPRSL